MLTSGSCKEEDGLWGARIHLVQFFVTGGVTRLSGWSGSHWWNGLRSLCPGPEALANAAVTWAPCCVPPGLSPRQDAVTLVVSNGLLHGGRDLEQRDVLVAVCTAVSPRQNRAGVS